jgi:hypothetical protein
MSARLFRLLQPALLLLLAACARQPVMAAEPRAGSPLASCSAASDGPPRLVVRRAWRDDARYRLVSTTIALDGRVIYKTSDPARLRAPLEIVYDAPSNPGPHQLLTAYTVRRTGDGVHAAQSGSRFYVPHEHWLVVPLTGVECATLTLYPSGGSKVTQHVD